jgi:hypothetical protein
VVVVVVAGQTVEVEVPEVWSNFLRLLWLSAATSKSQSAREAAVVTTTTAGKTTDVRARIPSSEPSKHSVVVVVVDTATSGNSPGLRAGGEVLVVVTVSTVQR